MNHISHIILIVQRISLVNNDDIIAIGYSFISHRLEIGVEFINNRVMRDPVNNFC